MASVKQNQQTFIIVLLAACFVMAAAVMYIQGGDKQQTLTGLDSASINRIRITQSTGRTFALELQNDQWHITEPLAQAANENRVEPLLSIAAIAPSYPSSEVDLEAAGLDTPIASISFNDKHFEIGELDVSGKRRYAQSEGQVYFFPEWIAPLIEGGINALAAMPAEQ